MGDRAQDLGTAPETSLRHRHRDLPGVRRGGADHRQHRGPRGDREDPHPPRYERRRVRSFPAAAVPGAARDRAVRVSQAAR